VYHHGGVEVRGRWWNGRYGRMARRDIWLLTNGMVWRVQARTGDADIDKWQHDYISEGDARAVIAGMIDRTGGPSGWRDLSSVRGRDDAPP
jgi:hypothetical protein